MEEGIKVQKTTLVLFVALIVVMILGAYIVSASSFNSGQGGVQKSGESSPRPDTSQAGGSPDPSPVLQGTGTDGGIGQIQDIYIHANRDGTYDKQQITVNQKQPVRLHFTADPSAGCGRQVVIYGLGVSASSMNGAEVIAGFTPKDAGTYTISCGMKMWGPSELIVR